MIKYIKAIPKALFKIFKHRKALIIAGKKLGVSKMRMLKHDNSKFHPIEFMQYVKRFELGIIESDKWSKAWEHHWRNNDHHIEYWEDRNLTYSWSQPDGSYDSSEYDDWRQASTKTKDHKCVGVFIPDDAIREMIADWIAASLAYSGEYPKAGSWQWGNENLVNMLKRMEINPQPEVCTRGFAVSLLMENGMITEDQRRQVWTLE